MTTADAGSGSQAEVPAATATASQNVLAWFVRGFAIALLIGLVSAHAPVRIKLVGLFAVGVAVLSGIAIARFSGPSGATSMRSRNVLLGLCILLGQIALAGEAYRLYFNYLGEHFANSPMKGPWPDYTPEQIEAMPAESREVAKQIQQEKLRRKELRAIPAFLQNRLPETMAAWADPWPSVWWIGECLIATLVGTLVSLRLLAPRSTAAEVAAASAPH